MKRREGLVRGEIAERVVRSEATVMEVKSRLEEHEKREEAQFDDLRADIRGQRDDTRQIRADLSQMMHTMTDLVEAVNSTQMLLRSKAEGK